METKTYYTYESMVFQCGGGSSMGELRSFTDFPERKPEIRQYFQTHGTELIVFNDPAEFCEFLETKYFNDGRTVFFKEEPNSLNYTVYTTSPHEEHKKEIFTVGILKRN